MIGGSRHGEIQTILHGRRAMSPRRGVATIVFEEYVVRHAPSISFDALVLTGLDDAGIETMIAGTGFEPAYPSL
ncbi:hypothetical protein [Bradyrhizobium sp. USDA 4529]